MVAVKAAGGGAAEDAAAATPTTTATGSDAGAATRSSDGVLDERVDEGGVAGDGEDLVGGIDGRNSLRTFLEAIRNPGRT